ncbi:hypothetical protein DFH09DRAFT_1084015 [Mycena vulgaris]|nr:hypothetical protein DFH09DRAFT_1084015 [Mycena vulgaris]
MQNIGCREKNYEFRRYRIAKTVQRIWFYLNAPFSHIAYICEIDPARTRNPGDPPLSDDGIGNAQFNTERGGEWERYDYAYRIRSVWKIKDPIALKIMKDTYNLKGAPRGLIYVPELMASTVVWEQQEYVSPALSAAVSVEDGAAANDGKGTKRKQRPHSESSGHARRHKAQERYLKAEYRICCAQGTRLYRVHHTALVW